MNKENYKNVPFDPDQIQRLFLINQTDRQSNSQRNIQGLVLFNPSKQRIFPPDVN